jgi:DUF438 domain-containing protein
MSEFSQSKQKRLNKLLEVSILTLDTGNARSFILENETFIDTVIPSDFIALFDVLVARGYPMESLKTCSNKLLNIFHRPIDNYPAVPIPKDSYLDLLCQNNKAMETILNEITPGFKQFNKQPDQNKLKKELLDKFKKLQRFDLHYTLKENVLFPVLEKNWPDYRCLQLMWSFHDSIRQNLKNIIRTLIDDSIELKLFNRWVGDVFFQMMAIKFREEKIVFPYLLETIDSKQLEPMIHESQEIGFPYINPSKKITKTPVDTITPGILNLGTGQASLEQIQLIFNHLPVDITFVDENDTVQYFSTPKKRIFPRTSTIIGRKVHNCHPPESVHIVEKIVASFKDGTKSQASFWIKMHNETILIQYFALRNAQNNYKGVIEVSQEISGIQALNGEKRLLDWD